MTRRVPQAARGAEPARSRHGGGPEPPALTIGALGPAGALGSPEAGAARAPLRALFVRVAPQGGSLSPPLAERTKPVKARGRTRLASRPRSDPTRPGPRCQPRWRARSASESPWHSGWNALGPAPVRSDRPTRPCGEPQRPQPGGPWAAAGAALQQFNLGLTVPYVAHSEAATDSGGLNRSDREAP
jgi:hypothetical protein